jgi:hypothetical protein
VHGDHEGPGIGWINYGAYRVQAYPDGRIASVMCSKGKHGDILMRRYHERGQRCPIAGRGGMHPLLFSLAGIEVAYGKNEYDMAGGLLGKPVEVILGPKTACRSRRTPRSPSKARSIRTTALPRARSASGPATTPAGSSRSR